MVEISKSVVTRPDVRANPNNGSQSAKPVTNSGSVKGQVDSVKLDSLDSEPAVKDMASAAPINKENVNRIKDAIRRGEYPIDLDRVSDALMEAYKEMKTWGIKDLAFSEEDVEVLQRIESVIDALEVRGITSSKFHDLCSELDACLKLFPAQKIMQDGVEGDEKVLFVSLIKRLKKLEIYAGTQSEITTGLNTYIDDLDK